MSTNADQTSYLIEDLDEGGYGKDGTLTRREWQDECIRMLKAGARSFNQWQMELQENEKGNPRIKVPSFDWIEIYSNSSKPHQRVGWSGKPSRFVLDVTNAVFEDQSLNLDGYGFMHGALFLGASFDGFVSMGADFFEAAHFEGSKFKRGLALPSAHFRQGVRFANARFDGLLFCNEKTRFEAGVSFGDVEFKKVAHFQGAQFANGDFMGARFYEDADFSGRIGLNENKLQTFGASSFVRAYFKGRANFSDREFTASMKLGSSNGDATRFDLAPLFHNCKIHQDTTFLDVQFAEPSRTDELAARAYNTLRLCMSQRQATREEQLFMRLELDSERVQAKGPMRALYEIYRGVSNYGFSSWKPLLMLILCPMLLAVLLFGVAISWRNCEAFSLSACQFSWSLALQVFEISVLQALPPLGLDKASDALRQTLLGASSPSIQFFAIGIVIFQKFLGLIGWFFVALALRNAFKLK